MPTFKIVTDSSVDGYIAKRVPYAVAPLKIITAEKEYTDNTALDVALMVEELAAYKGRSSTSCPNAEDWMEAFGDAQFVFCVTITGTLSGCYNAACAAKQMYEEQYPDRKVCVFNSLTTGPEMRLLIEKIEECLAEGMAFEDVAQMLPRYASTTGLLFMLESMKNLANNGRVSPFVAKAAGLLGIRVVGRASDKGDLQQLDKCRGQERALASIVKHMVQDSARIGKVRIAHCGNPAAADALRALIETTYEGAQVTVDHLGGLCSFYAEKGGLLVGYERI